MGRLSKRKQREQDIDMKLCVNPFRKKRCARPDIEVYILYEGETLGICSKCWKKISNGDQEWGDSTLETISLRTEIDQKVFKERGKYSKRKKVRRK